MFRLPLYVEFYSEFYYSSSSTLVLENKQRRFLSPFLKVFSLSLNSSHTEKREEYSYLSLSTDVTVSLISSLLCFF